MELETVGWWRRQQIKGAQTWENSPEQWQVTQLKAQTNSFQQTQKMKIPRMLQERTKKEKNRVRNHPLLLVRCKKMCIWLAEFVCIRYSATAFSHSITMFLICFPQLTFLWASMVKYKCYNIKLRWLAACQTDISAYISAVVPYKQVSHCAFIKFLKNFIFLAVWSVN